MAPDLLRRLNSVERPGERGLAICDQDFVSEKQLPTGSRSRLPARGIEGYVGAVRRADGFDSIAPLIPRNRA